MTERGGRSSDDRAAAREERERSRVAREQGVPLDEEQGLEEQPERSDEGWRPDLRSMSRYGGGVDVYARRRIVAALVIVGLIVVLFLMLGGC
jgi:hypothetical protein